MAIRTRFAASLLIFAILPSRWLFAQEAAAKNRPRAPRLSRRLQKATPDSQERTVTSRKGQMGCVVMRPNRMRTYPKALKEFNAHDCHPAISATS